MNQLHVLVIDTTVQVGTVIKLSVTQRASLGVTQESNSTRTSTCTCTCTDYSGYITVPAIKYYLY